MNQALSLKDAMGRRFRYLRLSVTDRCNYRCNYCLPNGYQGDDTAEPAMTLDEIETLVSAFAAMGTRKIRLTGGEPATRKDLTRIIEVCKRTPGIEEVVLTTNGYNLSKKAAEWKAAGLDGINVSLDSLDRDRFKDITGHDHLPRVLDGLEQARAVGFTRLKINAVLLRQFNWDQFDHFLNFVRKQAVAVRFIELMQTGDNAVFFRENSVLGSQMEEKLQLQGWQEVPKTPLDGPAREFRHPDFAGKIGLIMPYSKDFCRNCNRLRVASNGNLHLCLFADQGHSLRKALSAGETVSVIRQTRLLLESKAAGHTLEQGFTGATSSLAMLGG
ncbi:MAG: GTP 3',8-cyclase MoaA [Hahellaceae bacterium]|jgi:cyclic pyranopterin phosphate synthase|nr:GTP 3',8-cyclase MoaA [Hahellaceae bacterium]